MMRSAFFAWGGCRGSILVFVVCFVFWQWSLGVLGVDCF